MADDIIMYNHIGNIMSIAGLDRASFTYGYTSIRFLPIIISTCRYPYRKIEYQKQTGYHHQQTLQYSIILDDSRLQSQ